MDNPNLQLACVARSKTRLVVVALLASHSATAETNFLWYVDCSDRLKETLSGGAPGQIEDQCDDRAVGGYTAPVRETLQDATRWLTHLHGFRAPDADHIPIDKKQYFVAIVYDDEYEDICLGREGCFDLEDRRVYVPDSYVRGADDVIVHELFHAIQLAYRGSEFFELAVSSSVADPYGLSHLRGWITEGTAEAVAQAWVVHKGSGEVQGPRRRHDHPLHESDQLLDDYRTARFWLFLGTELESSDRIAYLERMLQVSELSTGNGVFGVDKFLKPYGGLFALFPRFLATLPVDGTFGELAQWQVRLPAGQTQATRHFRGNVREIAGTAARLSVTHSSAKPVAVTIRFRGDDSNLHLLVDGAVRVLGPGGARNVFTTQMQSPSQTFELIIAEVAEQAEQSRERDFELEVEVREEPSAWVRLNGETFEVLPHICNSQGVVVNALPNTRSISFSIMARGNSTRVAAWGDSGVGAYLFSEGMYMSAYGWTQPDGGGSAGGLPPADKLPPQFQVDMAYDMERGQWIGSGTLHSRRHGFSQIEFSIQCRPENRKVIR